MSEEGSVYGTPQCVIEEGSVHRAPECVSEACMALHSVSIRNRHRKHKDAPVWICVWGCEYHIVQYAGEHAHHSQIDSTNTHTHAHKHAHTHTHNTHMTRHTRYTCNTNAKTLNHHTARKNQIE